MDDKPNPIFWLILLAGIASFVVFISIYSKAAAEPKFDPIESLAYIDTPEGTGSGFFVSPTIVITAKHVVAGAKDLTVYDARGSAYKTASVELIEHTDAAIVTLNTPSPVVPAVISCEKPSRLDPLVVSGNPLDIRDIVTVQTVAGFLTGTDAPEGERIETTGMLASGMSGGPVFNQDNHVLGISVEEIIYMAEPGHYMPSELNGVVPLYDIPQLCGVRTDA